MTGSGQHGEPARDRPRKVFISYRRADAAAEARLLYEGLARRLGAENVFLDVETIRAGADWLAKIRARGADCGAFLVLIGPSWLSTLRERVPASAGAPVQDVVMREIELALSKGSSLQVVPVLVGGTSMPAAEKLPKSIRPLVTLNAQELRHASWNRDFEDLIEQLNTDGGELEALPPVPPSRRRTRITAPPPAARILPDTAHCDRVLSRLQDGTLVPILGSGVNAGDRREAWVKGSGLLPDAHELAGALAQRFHIQEEQLDLAETAQSVYVKDGRNNLYRTLRQILAADEFEPGAVHRFLAGLPAVLREQEYPAPYQMIVTANYDKALEQAFDELREPYDLALYMASGRDEGRFIHIPWHGTPTPVVVANEYRDFPFLRDSEWGEDELERTLIVKIYGAVDHEEGGYRWSENYVITEDHYIDYLSGIPASSLVPMQILRKLLNSHCLFLGYPMHDWSLRVFLKRIWEGRPFEAPSFAVACGPDLVEQDFWRQCGVELVTASLDDYVDALNARLLPQPDPLARGS